MERNVLQDRDQDQDQDQDQDRDQDRDRDQDHDPEGADERVGGGGRTRPRRVPLPSGASAARGARTTGDAGMTTAEYAVGTVAACGFAGVLVALLSSDRVRGLLAAVLERALTVGA